MNNAMMNPFANVFAQNPFTTAQNPFTMWQGMMEQATKNFTTACGMPVPTAKATAEPFAFSPLMQGNPVAMFQQMMEFWQQFMPAAAKAAMPAPNGAAEPAGAWPFMGAFTGPFGQAGAANNGLSPKVTMMTVELGDMTPYMKQASEFVSQWQNMWLQNASGQWGMK